MRIRGACIDIGSNTTRLLVAERDDGGRLRPVLEERVFTRLGAALANGGTISSAKRDEVIGVVADQLDRARSHGVARPCGVATAAVRAAGNGGQLIDELRARTGLEVTVLSDAQEARLAFRGAAAMLETAGPAPLGVLDIGGGSSEIVIGTPPEQIDWWISLPLGSGTLAARHPAVAGPPDPHQLAELRADVDAALDAIDWSRPAPARIVAVGGSATSLGRVAGRRLDAATLARALTLLGDASPETVAARFEISVDRAQLLPAGLVILERLQRRFGGPVEVGSGGIREGVLLEALS